MDTEKRQSLVKRHEQIDARVWNQFFGAWWPLAPWSEMSVTYRADLGVDQGTVTVPYSHPCASIFRQVRDGVPAPITIEVNGVFISGQITTAQAERAEETQAWHLTIQTDAKHAHSMMARPLVQSAADNAETQLRGFLGPVARQLIGLASSRTGLPTYVCIDGEGDPVDLVVRTEDTVADVLADALAGSDLFVDVRMLLPGQDLPGESAIERFAGPVERKWENAALDAGLWPHAETDERLIDVVEGPDGVVPPFSWRKEASVNHVGEPLEEPAEGYVWLPFATQAPYIGSEYYGPDRPLLDGSRVITDTDLGSHAKKFPGWASFVTEWKPGAVFAELRENERLHEAAKAGLLRLPDGTKLPDSWGRLGPLLREYLGLEERNYTTPGAYAWRDGASWVISNAEDMVTEKEERAANPEQKQTPGVLFHFYPERDRRGITFSTVPGGGLKAWSATYAAPEGAMLIAAAQMDEWTMNQLGLGNLPQQAVTGQQSATPAGASTMKNIPDTIYQVDVDVQPQARLEGSDIAYHAAGGRVDIAKAGPFFYREKYLNLDKSGTINPVQQMTQEWSRAQGSTTVQLTPSGRGSAVFGDDIVGDDGRRIPGWRHGDRVSFVDGDTRISEVIVGWTLTANAGEPLEVSPILGREDNGVLAQLGERLRGAELASKKTALSPPRRIPSTEIDNRAEAVFIREGSAWSQLIQVYVDAATAASRAAHEASQASLGHSEAAGAHSDVAAGHSADANAASVVAAGHSEAAAGHADVASGHSADASLASQAAAGHSGTAAGHSADASLASQAARDASTTASEHSGSAWDYSQLADQAALAAGVSEVDAAEWKRLAEVARSLAEQERDAAETARADAEDARDAAETARSAAESGRADAEAARDLAEQARDKATASMTAAETMRAEAEEARRLAEVARGLAEASRSNAEDERRDAEAARDLAEGYRSNAFIYMNSAFNEWEKAEDERESAWEAHQAVVDQNSLNVDDLEKQLVDMRQELEKVRGRQWDIVSLGPNGSVDDFTTTSSGANVTLSVAGTWTGRIVATFEHNPSGSNTERIAPAVYTWEVGVNRTFVYQRPYDQTVMNVRLDYRRAAAQVMQSNTTLRNHATSQGGWSVLHFMSVPKAAEGIASIRVGWHAATYGDQYGVRIRVGGSASSGGTVVASTGPRTGLGPRTILGNGYRVQTASSQSFQVPMGAFVWLESYSTGSTATRREIRDATLNIAWIDRG